MSARADLAAALKADLAEHSDLKWRVIPHATDIDRVEAGHLVLMVFQNTVTPGLARSLSRSMALRIVTGRINPGDADDELDQGLDDVIAALDRISPALFQNATRGTLQDDAYPAYLVEVQLITQKG